MELASFLRLTPLRTALLIIPATVVAIVIGAIGFTQPRSTQITSTVSLQPLAGDGASGADINGLIADIERAAFSKPVLETVSKATGRTPEALATGIVARQGPLGMVIGYEDLNATVASNGSKALVDATLQTVMQLRIDQAQEIKSATQRAFRSADQKLASFEAAAGGGNIQTQIQLTQESINRLNEQLALSSDPSQRSGLENLVSSRKKELERLNGLRQQAVELEADSASAQNELTAASNKLARAKTLAAVVDAPGIVITEKPVAPTVLPSVIRSVLAALIANLVLIAILFVLWDRFGSGATKPQTKPRRVAA